MVVVRSKVLDSSLEHVINAALALNQMSPRMSK